MATTTPVIPVLQVRKGEYGCDGCDATDVPKLVLINARKKVDLMLCDGCLARREARYGRPFPAKAIYNILSVVPRQENNETEREETPEEHRAFVNKVAGVLDARGFKVEKHVPVKQSFNGERPRRPISLDEQVLARPRRPILLNHDVSLTFELVSVELAACTLGIVSRACDAVENRPEFSKLTILPPVEGTSRFEVIPCEDGVLVDLPALKRALVEALEAMV